MNFAVGIVLYNGDISKIQKALEEYKSFARKVILVDNNSKNINEIEKITINFPNIKLIKNNENMGIAKALNQILNESYQCKIDYLLTLDQDSFIEYKDVERMIKYLRDDVAIVSPEIYDLNKKKNKRINSEYEEIERSITSGSIMNLKICKKIGSFDEKMFIDYVDFDYSKRVRLEGYKILKIRDCLLKHEIGKRTIKRFLGIYVYPTNHSSFRVYYYFRNMHYYYLKYKNNMNLRERANEIIRIVWKFISIILYEDDKKNKIMNARKGFLDSKKMI